MYIPLSASVPEKCCLASNKTCCRALALPVCQPEREYSDNNSICELVGIGLGSNLGPSAVILRSVLHSLHAYPRIRLLAHSSFYASRPVGMRSENWFVNAVALLNTSLSPRELMLCLQGIEASYGRVRTPSAGQRLYQDRILDLDILFYGDQLIEEADLVIPHPRMLERLFVLKPLAEIAGEHCHPLCGESFFALARKLQDNLHEHTAHQTVVKIRHGDHVFWHAATACAYARRPEPAESFLL